MELKLKRLEHGDGLPLPSYSTAGSAGLDVCAAADGRVWGSSPVIVPTGFAVAVPQGFELQVRSRSGLAAKHGVSVLNSPGTIDEDYRGEIMVILTCAGNKVFEFKRGDRIAQLVLAPVVRGRCVEVDELDGTARGAGGLGSTGV